jgi:hypothetical protein
MYGKGEQYLVGKWYQAIYKPRGLHKKPTHSALLYSPGFHIFLKKENAITAVRPGEVMRKVRYRGAHTLGQGRPGILGGPQVVANSIMIMLARSK